MSRRYSVSNAVFGASIIVLLIIAALGYSLYFSALSQVTTTSITSTTTSVKTVQISPKLSGAFYNGSVVTFIYKYDYACVPKLSSFFPNQTDAASKTDCVVGAGKADAEQGAAPLWVLVPAYAGLSIFGVEQLGATASGLPRFQNKTLITNCGAGLTPTACVFHPSLLYSPAFTVVEQHLGITNGIFGLPEGVLPTPAHNHIINCCFAVIPWYTIVVLVFDPNIFPNAVTGECSVIVPSNLTSPTSNCLNSYDAIVSAFNTKSSSVQAANKGNPIWEALGKPSTQIVIPGASVVSQISNANSNLFEHFTVNSTNFYFSP